jgi:hypothetical protein
MTAFVFVGPTLDEKSRPRNWEVEYLPPVEQGQVHALIRKNPTAIGIVDGRFHDVPAVWHKEILAALHEGIPVYGSASMGALRASELSSFGMRGVGEIYAAYENGEIEDDDEVTVAHAGEEDTFLQISDAMVNIRANLARAFEAGRVSAATRDRLLGIAKNTFYAQRNLGLILIDGLESGLPRTEIDSLREFLRGNRIDQKKIDAIAMIDAMRQDVMAGGSPATGFAFERTFFFERACRSGFTDDGDGGWIRIHHLLAELRFEPRLYVAMRRRAVGSVITDRHGPVPDARRRTAAALARFRRDAGLTERADWRRWLAEQGYTEDQFTVLVRDEVAARSYAPHGEALNLPLLRELESSPAYGEIMRRVRAKGRFLEQRGIQDAASRVSDQASEDDIVRWYFRTQGIPLPAVLDRYAKSLDFLGLSDFLRSLRVEFHVRRARQQDTGAGSARHEIPGLDGESLRNRISQAVWESEWAGPSREKAAA